MPALSTLYDAEPALSQPMMFLNPGTYPTASAAAPKPYKALPVVGSLMY